MNSTVIDTLIAKSTNSNNSSKHYNMDDPKQQRNSVEYDSGSIGGSTKPIRESHSIRVFVDGACLNNGTKRAIGGIGVFFGDNDKRNLSRGYQHRDVCSAAALAGNDKAIILAPEQVTNQTMELLAAIYGLLQCNLHLESQNSNKTQNSCMSCVITVLTDSQYVVKCMNTWAATWQRNGWRTADGKGAVKNQALIRTLLNLRRRAGCPVSFVHVRAHKAEPADRGGVGHLMWWGNFHADALASQAAHAIAKQQRQPRKDS